MTDHTRLLIRRLHAVRAVLLVGGRPLEPDAVEGEVIDLPDLEDHQGELFDPATILEQPPVNDPANDTGVHRRPLPRTFDAPAEDQ